MADRVLELLGQIDEKQNEAAVALKAVQERNDKFEEGQTGFEEGMRKAAEDTEKHMAELQEVKGKLDSIEKTAEYMEKAITRMGDGTAEDKELESKAHDEMCRYMRHGAELSDDVKLAIINSMTEKMYHGLTDAEKDMEVKALVAGVNPEGGYFLRPERQANMIQRIFETSPMRRFASIVTTATDSIEFIIDDEEPESGGWVGETTPRGETGNNEIGKLTIAVHEQFAQPLATQKMLDDAGFDIEAWLSGKVSAKMSRVENTAFVVGDGAQKPRGFLDYPAWAVPGTYERGAVEQIGSEASAAVSGDDFKRMQNSLIEDYQGSAVWLMKRESFFPVVTLKDSTGRYIFQSRFIDNRDEMRLLGKEIVFMNDMPVVAADSLSYAYGDFGMGYTIVDRLGFRVIRDIFTRKPYIKFYTTKRVGAAVTNYQSFKILVLDGSN